MFEAKAMRPCSPSEFVRRWPGSLRPVVFPEPPPALPEEGRKWLAEFGLPRELTITCYNDITLRFSGAATPLATIWERDLKRGLQLIMRGYPPGVMPGDWTRFWHLADQEYVQGGGWIGIEEITGRLVVIDLDLHEPIYLLNSSVGHFYTTLSHLLEWSVKTGGSPAETAHLRDALRGQDCIPPEELEPFWLNIIDTTLDCESINLAVSLGPKKDEPGAAANAGRR